MDDAYKDVRIWQTHFSLQYELENLPVPEMIVEELQHSSSYRWDGKFRTEDGSQIIITLSGKGAVDIAGKEFTLNKGKALLHNHDDPDICYYYPDDAGEPWRFLWFAFYGADSRRLITEINGKRGYIFDVPENSELVAQLREYRKHAGVIQIIPPFEGGMLVYGALEKLCKEPEENSSFYSHRSMVSAVQRIIAADPAAELQVEKLAGNFNISREHLSRIFCREAGVSLHEYIIRFRLKLAVDLLRRTRLSLKEVSCRCGWNDYSNFYRLFVKRYKQSPLEIRQGVKREIREKFEPSLPG